MQKRGKLIVLLVVGFLFLVLVPLVMGEKQCPTKAGDANGDGNVDISDASTILRYLFTPGSMEPCRNNADADANGILSITDAIRILNFLFRGGEPPESADRPIELGYINYDADVNDPDIIAPLEITVPGKIDILDTAFEDPPIYNIKKCEAYKEEDGEPVLFYSATWEDKDVVNIKNQPLIIPIELTEFLTDAEYNIKVRCWEQDGDSGEVSLKIKTKPQIVFNPDNFPRVECSLRDRCCRRSDESYYCSVDIGRGAPVCDADDIEVSQNDCCYPYQAGPDRCLVDNRIWQLANSKEENKKYEYIPLEEETSAHQCRVEKMTIITKGGSLVFGGENNDEPPLPIPEPIQGTPSFNGNGLGHGEGWVEVNTNIGEVPYYNVRFVFYIFAWLSEGSQPDKCAEHQFEKQTEIEENGDAVTRNIAPSMYNYNEITSTLSMYNIPIMEPNEIFQMLQKSVPLKDGCSFNGDELCDDNYGRPGARKIHMPGNPNRRPRIVWIDSPGVKIHFTRVNGATEEQPWNSNTGKADDFRSKDMHFVSIIEGTNYNRWVCELELHFQNLGAQATSTKKFDVQEKFCECRKQSREFSDAWIDTGDINSCNTT